MLEEVEFGGDRERSAASEDGGNCGREMTNGRGERAEVTYRKSLVADAETIVALLTWPSSQKERFWRIISSRNGTDERGEQCCAVFCDD